MTEATSPKPASAADLFAAAAGRRRFKDLTLPVMGLAVRIRSLTERELTAYTSAVMADTPGKLKKAKLEDATRRLIVACLVDAAGNRLLTEADAPRLADWDSADTQHLYNECAAWVGLKAADVEDLVKNSERIPGDG